MSSVSQVVVSPNHTDRVRHRSKKMDPEQHDQSKPVYIQFQNVSNQSVKHDTKKDAKPFGRLHASEFNKTKPSQVKYMFNNGMDTALTECKLRQLCADTDMNLDQQIVNCISTEQTIDSLVRKYKKLMQQPGSKDKTLPSTYRYVKMIQKQIQRRGNVGKFKGHGRKKQRAQKWKIAEPF